MKVNKYYMEVMRNWDHGKILRYRNQRQSAFIFTWCMVGCWVLMGLSIIFN